MIEDFHDILAALVAPEPRFLVVGAHALAVPPWRIDITTGISGVSFADAWEGRLTDAMLGVPVSFIGRVALIRNKRASGRSKDLGDVKALEE